MKNTSMNVQQAITLLVHSFTSARVAIIRNSYIIFALALVLFAPATTQAATSVGHWALDETSGTTAADSSGNSNTGTLTNGPVWTAGQIGNGLAFDGVDDLVNCGSGASLDNLPAISVTAWIRPTSMGEGPFGRIVHKGVVNNPSGTNGGFRVYLTGTNQLQFDGDFATTDLARRSSSDAITLNAWQHVAATWTGSATATTAKLYVNGVETTYAITTNGVGARPSDATASFYIGNSSKLDRTFNGVIDDVRVYSDALTATEVQALYQAGVLPASPSGLVASAASSSQIDLSWTDNSNNETGFEIDRALHGGFTTGLVVNAYTAGANATSVAATGLSASTTYYFRARATNANGDSANSDTASATTQAAGSPPAAPGTLAASAVSSSQIDLSWTDNSNNETGFEIDRALDSGFTTGLVVNAYTAGANATSVAATGLSASTTYYFRTRATNANGDSANSNTASATTQAAGNWQLSAGHWVNSPLTMPTGGADTSSKMRIVHPRPDAETSPYAFCRNAYPGIPFRIPISVVGGAWPLKYEVVSGPSGMSVGETYGSIDYGILTWTNPVTSGSPHTVTVRVTDQAGNTQDRTWTVNVNTANFIFVQDGYSGTKTGSITQPFEDFVDFNGNAAYANKLCIVRAGGYALVLNQGVYMGTTAPRVIMGHTGEAKPVVTCTNAVFQPDQSDTFVAWMSFKDSRPDIADSKFIAFNKLTHRCGVFEADFRNQMVGTAGTDNPCSIWVNGQGTNYRDHFLISHCTTDNFGAALCILYHVRYAVVERNTLSNNKPTMGVNGAYGLKVKSDSIYVSVRANVGVVGLSTPDGVIEITNQEQGVPCDQIEVCWNKIKCNSATNNAMRFWGDAPYPYRDRYSYRNTYYGQVRVLNLAKLRCSFTNDIAVNDNSPQIPISKDASIVTKTDNLERPTSNNPLDAAGDLTGPDRTTYLGIRGAEVD